MHARIGHNAEPWDVRIEIRPGVWVQTLGPMEAGEAPSSLGAAIGGQPWPGLLAWLWRALVGGIDHGVETRLLRAQYRAVTPPEAHAWAGRLSGGELMVFVAAYMRAQILWMGRVEARVAADIAAQNPGDAQPPPPPPVAGARPRPAPGARLVMPGGHEVRVPDAASGPPRQPWTPEAFERRYGGGTA